MNSDQFQGHLRTMKGWVLESWGRATNDPWLRIAGRREQLLGSLAVSLEQSRRVAEAGFPHQRGRAALPRRAATR